MEEALDNEMGDEAAAAHEESEEAVAPEKKTKRSKQAGQGSARKQACVVVARRG